MLSQFFHCEGNASNTSWWQNQSSAGTLVLPLVLFRQRSKNHQDKFLKRRFPWRFCGLLQWNLQCVRQAGCSGHWWQCFTLLSEGVGALGGGRCLCCYRICSAINLQPQTSQPALPCMYRQHERTEAATYQCKIRGENWILPRGESLLAVPSLISPGKKQGSLNSTRVSTKTWTTTKLREQNRKHRIIFIICPLYTGNWISSKSV